MYNLIRFIPRKILHKILGLIGRITSSLSHQKATRYYNSFAIQNEQRCFAENNHNEDIIFSIIVPAFNPDNEHFKELIYSIVNQHYSNWELIVVNASTQKGSRKFIEECALIDLRIKVKSIKNQGISENTNIGAEFATGKYLVFLDHDDLLHPCALHSVAQTISKSNSDIVYSDQDKIDQKSKRYYDPFSKPDWSIRLLENVNYINHLTVVKKSLFQKLGGLRSEFNGAQDYDFLLRAADFDGVRINHIARYLYHWRAAKTSTASDISAKSYIFSAGKKALEEHYERTGEKFKVEPIRNKPGFYKPDIPKAAYAIVIGPVEPMYYAQTVVFIKKLRKITNAPLVIEEWITSYNIDSWLDNYTTVHDITSDKEVGNELSGAVRIRLGAGSLPRSEADLDMIASASKYLDAQVQPLIIDTNHRVVDAGFVKTTQGLERLFRGTLFGKSTPLGNNDWVRSVDALSGDVEATANNSSSHFLLWPHSVFIYHGPFVEPRDMLSLNPQISTSGQPKVKNIFWDNGWLYE